MTAPAFDAALRDRVFEPALFDKRFGEEDGLRPVWSRSLIQRFGGSIRVENNLDRGCTFVMNLPAFDAERTIK